ncbi:MAG: HAMP domain-containing histidine kinase [Syntrophales bacterium]|nr:HAMP domain-containing histidine kinase [Syntrophales bacterium]
MNRFRWFYHPLFIFIFSIVALAASLTLYIYWYIEVSTGLAAVIQRYQLDPSQFLEVQTWVVILVLCILMAIILSGVFIIFIYNQKTQQLYRMQRNFINSFTHELKTPVTSLKLYLETFAKHDLPREDRLRYVGFMIHDVDRLLDNINRIMDLARIESGSYRKEFVETDLVAAVERFRQSNADLFRNAAIRVHKPAAGAFRGSVIPPLFDMFLMNILTNAVKYNQSGAPAVDIRFVPRGKELQLRFEDNGIGIEKSELRNIFKKFYQVGSTDDMTAKGSGLGLYLARQIAKIHRGKLTAESRGAGKGSVFTLTLPLQAIEG